jgi:valyl-tRNA synthetase
LEGKKDEVRNGDIEETVFENWLLIRRDQVTEALRAHLDGYAFNHAAQLLYDFVWHEVCDWAIEWVKWDARCRTIRPSVLQAVLKDSLKLLHPFMPFVTEELWRSLGEKEFLMLSSFPVSLGRQGSAEAVHAVQKCIEAFRQYRGEHTLSFKLPLRLVPVGKMPAWWTTHGNLIANMVNLEILPQPSTPGSGPMLHVEGASFLLSSLDGLSNAKERERLQRELKKLELMLSHIATKLNNPLFLEKAPATLVEAERSKQGALVQKIQVTRDALKGLGD